MNNERVVIKVTDAFSPEGRQFIGQFLPVYRSTDPYYEYKTEQSDKDIPFDARERLFNGEEVELKSGNDDFLKLEEYKQTVRNTIIDFYYGYSGMRRDKLLVQLGLAPVVKPKLKRYRVSWEYESEEKLPSAGFKLVSDVHASGFKHEEVTDD